MSINLYVILTIVSVSLCITMNKHVRTIISELQIILAQLSLCILSIKRDCTSEGFSKLEASNVMHKLDTLRKAVQSIQKLCNQIKDLSLNDTPVSPKLSYG